METMELMHNGFHGRHSIRIRPLAFSPAAGGRWARISRRVIERINRELCSARDCRCGEQISAADRPGGDVIPICYLLDTESLWVWCPEDGYIQGNYPQAS